MMSTKSHGLPESRGRPSGVVDLRLDGTDVCLDLGLEPPFDAARQDAALDPVAPCGHESTDLVATGDE